MFNKDLQKLSYMKGGLRNKWSGKDGLKIDNCKELKRLTKVYETKKEKKQTYLKEKEKLY